jgi:iron complex outermembrane receptor protein
MPSRTRDRAPSQGVRATPSFPHNAGSRIGVAVAAALATVAAPRAPAAAAAAADTSSTGPLQEVVVTARKREENLQDVPLSINVFTHKDLQNLGIASFDDYAQRVPSLSFISEGPGTQLFVMRGASDGSSPNYANTCATGFFIDDISMCYGGSQPDLHLYDIERVEILNGPQGTTFGASAMTGAIRYITNKPDVNAFSAGADFDGGTLPHGGQHNQTYEGFLNAPLIEGRLGVRLSAFSDSHGGFIKNALTSRNWVNGTSSDNAQWAANNYNREHIEGGRLAVKGVLNDQWSALVTYSYQRQSTRGAWDEDPTLPARTVARFGPEARSFQAKETEFRIDGDVGIGDLIFASTYWAQPTRQWNEYSQYMQNVNAGSSNVPPTGFPGTPEGFTCLDDPYYGTAYKGCKVPTQFYEYHTNPELYSDELRLESKPGGRAHWLAGLYWEKTIDRNSGSTYYIPNLQYQGTAYQFYNTYGLTTPSLPAGVWYAYTTRTDYLQTDEFANISFDFTDKLNVEAGVVHFHSDASYYTPYGQFAYGPAVPALYKDSSHKWNSKFGINYKLTDKAMVYANFAQGFRDGGSNSGDPQKCYNKGVPLSYTPDTLNNYEIGWKTTSLNGRLLWNGATYFMDWKQLQTILYDLAICASSSFNINIGDARIYGAETNLDYHINDRWEIQAAASYTDSHIISAQLPQYQIYVGERLPYAPYFSWSWNARYEQPIGTKLRGYVQFDMAHKGDMWNDINPNSPFTGLARVLQPAFTLMNLRLGLTPAGAHWLAEFYVTNLADKNTIVFSNTGNFDLRLTTNQPRVIGLRVNYRFGKETNSE